MTATKTMTLKATRTSARQGGYHGLRMSAEQYLQLEDDGTRYELIDGVVTMSPSALPHHQKVATRIAVQIGSFLETHPVGEVYTEVDVHLGVGPRGGDLVYWPDVVFLREERVPGPGQHIKGPPDLVVEVVSSDRRRYDYETKKDDYEGCGVHEYWIIDPELQQMTFYRRREDRFVEIQPEGDKLPSEAIPGFSLDLAKVRKSF